ncbi:prolyl-tRNA synthetase associated domain-containing protein [Anaerosphaera multitolerans]|uniref:Prolyl-tRNA synthetase associated domain-containing protein n=1 Tax=Anaerosphaera multitolerans TaxID=2487351 RepID=A0A437S4R6_9FIRM|nr:prolyl-tRNA synthetase associated domain-containing protein [Anaerosphaera multitolerans]RVU53947.1 prolyl-tRNA synthetase associated domain-containing protein [Anaerosphaera multitolerans]
MEKYKPVYNLLKNLNISFSVVEHPPVYTTEEADKYIEGIDAVPTKTLFLCNRKKNKYYLVIMDDKKILDMKKLGDLIGEKGMKFASPEKLKEKMDLTPGMVSIFGLMNNTTHDINLCLDRDMLDSKNLTFHPNDNTKTLIIATKAIYKLLKKLDYEFKIIDL